MGHLKAEDHCLEKDPDRRVQEAILLVFRKSFELGTIRQVLLWFLEAGLQLRAHKPTGQPCWKRPTYSTGHRILTNPAYGGAYADGRTECTLHNEGSKPRWTR